MSTSAVASSFQNLLADAGLGDVAAQMARLDDERVRLMRRARMAAVFDEGIYERLIAADASLLSFESFIDACSVVESSALRGFYTIADEALDEELERPGVIDAEIRRYCGALLEEWRNRVAQGTDALWLIPHLWVEGEDAVVAHLDHLIRSALDGVAMDLDRADFVWRVFSAHTWWITVTSSGFEERTLQIRRRIDVRKIFASDHYKSARYQRRPLLHDRLEAFLPQNGPNDSKWILPIFAAGGIGKTILLRHVATHEWLRADRLVARIDFDHIASHHLARAPWLVLLPLALQWSVQLSESALASILRNKESWSRFLTPRHTAGAAVESDRPIGPEPETPEWQEEIRRQAEHITRSLKEQDAVIVLDTTEEPCLHDSNSLQLFSALLRLFAEMHTLHPRLRIIMAGRYNLFGIKKYDGSERLPGLAKAYTAALAPVLEISGFDQQETLSLLSDCYRLKITDDVAMEVFKQARDPKSGLALPFDLDLWARWLRDEPSVTAETIRDNKDINLRYLVERVLQRIPDTEDEVRWLVRYGSVPRRLTFPIARDALIPLIRQERMRRQLEASPPLDLPNQKLMEQNLPSVYGEQREDKIEEHELWAQLVRYASGPEQGWLNPDPLTGQLRLHERVLTPLHEDLQRQKVWHELHRRVKTEFEKHATASGVEAGSDTWCDAMSEALYHSCRQNDSAATDLWQRVVQQLRPNQWNVLGKLGEGLLGDGGFDLDEEMPVARLDDEGRRYVSETLESQAAYAVVVAALWNWALNTEPEERQILVTDWCRSVKRWHLTTGFSAHPLSGVLDTLSRNGGALLLAAAAETSTVITAVARIAQSSKDDEAVLLDLVSARLAELEGRLEPVRSFFNSAIRRMSDRQQYQIPVSVSQLRVIQAWSMVALQKQPDRSADSLEKLLKSAQDLPVSRQILIRLQAAELWLLCHRPANCLSLLTSSVRSLIEEPELRGRVAVLRARAKAALGHWDSSLTFIVEEAELEINALEPTPSLRVLKLQLAGLRALQMTALAKFATAASLARKTVEDYETWEGKPLTEARILIVQQAFSLCFQQGNRIEAHALMSNLRDGATNIEFTDAETNAQLRALEVIFLEPSQRPAFYASLRESLPAIPSADYRLPLMAQLVSAEELPLESLILDLLHAQPHSIRFRSLHWLRTSRTHQPPAFSAELQDLNPTTHARKSEQAGLASLHLAELYRVCGHIRSASEVIKRVTKTAEKRNNTWLWWQAAEASARLDQPFKQLPAELPENAPISVILRLCHLEQMLDRETAALSKQVPEYLQILRQIQCSTALPELAHTQYEVRHLALEAVLAAHCFLTRLPLTDWPANTDEKDFPALSTARHQAALELNRRLGDIGPHPMLERAKVLLEELKANLIGATQLSEINESSEDESLFGQTFLQRGRKFLASLLESLRPSFKGVLKPEIAELNLEASAFTYKFASRTQSVGISSTEWLLTMFQTTLEGAVREWEANEKQCLREITRIIKFGMEEASEDGAAALSMHPGLPILHSFPWEIAFDQPRIYSSRASMSLPKPLLFRGSSSHEDMSLQATRWIQDVLKRKLGMEVTVDGIIGPQTLGALEKQKAILSQDSGLGSLLHNLQRRLPSHGQYPQIFALQMRSQEDGIDLKRRSIRIRTGRSQRGDAQEAYRKAGILHFPEGLSRRSRRGMQPEAPVSLADLEQLTRDEMTMPHLWHVFCPLSVGTDSSSIRLAWEEPVSAAALAHVIKRGSTSPSSKPVLLLDIILPRASFEKRLAILQRNTFAADLWERDLFNGIIATCWEGERPVTDDEDRLDMIASCVSQRRTLGETAWHLRDSLWGPLAYTTALWAHHPGLPFCF